MAANMSCTNPRDRFSRRRSLPTHEESFKAAKEALIHEQLIAPEANGDLVEDPSIVFVSIDFEVDHEIAGPPGRARISEMGISTFDTRDLIRHEAEPHKKIQSQNHQCQKKRGKPYVFGQSTEVAPNELGEILERAVCQYDPNGNPRRVIIVAHSVFADVVTAKKHLGIDLSDRDAYPWIVGFLDTDKLSRTTLLRSELAFGSWTLQCILETLSIPYAYLHTAGNDANFTLKALLMLCIRALESADSIDPRQEARLAIVRSLAQASIESFLRERKLEKSMQLKKPMQTEKQDKNKLQATVQEGVSTGSEKVAFS